MRRREFISGVGGHCGPWDASGRGGGGVDAVVGILNTGSPGSQVVTLFKQGLKEAGFIEGQNVAFEYRWAELILTVFRYLQQLVRRHVTMIFANTAAARAAKAATTTIPIVFRLPVGPR